MWKNRNLRSLIEVGWTKYRFRDFTTTPLPIPKIFLVVYLLNLRSECLVSYDPHFPGNDGTNEAQKALADWGAASHYLAPWETPASSMARILWRLHLKLRMKRKKKQRIIARGIFRSLAPLLGLGNCRLSLGLWYRADDTGT